MELGHGSMGVTYKALDTSLHCHVALKVIAASLLGSSRAEERFLQEARSAARLRHRNVASVFHLGKRDETYYYAMELIDGETVEGLVRREGPINCLTALGIAEQVACALIAAEKHHLVHRDIKPSNLMLVRESDGDLLVKVIDFGLVKFAIAQDDSLDGLTLGGFTGTPCFASPEQLAQRDEDARSDIYSLGVTLWYMLTGKPTFSGSLTSVIAQHLGKSPPFETLASLPSASVTLLRRMLEKDVARRIQSPAELRAEFKRCINEVRTIAERGCETLELSASGKLTSHPTSGSMPEARSRLFEDRDADEPDPSNVTDFHYPLDQVLPCAESSRRAVAVPVGSLIPGRAPKAPLQVQENGSSISFARFLWLRILAASIAVVLFLGAASAVWNAAQYLRRDIPAASSVASPKDASKSAAVALSPPRPGQPWTNTLGIRFVPLGDIHMAAFQTRVRDFEIFVQTTHYDAEGGMSSAVKQDAFERRRLSWKSPGFPQTPDDPVVGVSWEDVDQFCAWLTEKERSEGAITAFQHYRLPTDREWSEAVGLLHEDGDTPEKRSGGSKGIYPWGDAMPPPEGTRNYAGEESQRGALASWNFLNGYRDPFPRTAPVTAMLANALGLQSLGGNVWEWCLDRFNRTTNWRVLRGGSWATSRPEEMLSSYRRGYDPLFRMDDVGFRLVIAAQDSRR